MHVVHPLCVMVLLLAFLLLFFPLSIVFFSTSFLLVPMELYMITFILTPLYKSNTYFISKNIYGKTVLESVFIDSQFHHLDFQLSATISLRSNYHTSTTYVTEHIEEEGDPSVELLIDLIGEQIFMSLFLISTTYWLYHKVGEM